MPLILVCLWHVTSMSACCLFCAFAAYQLSRDICFLFTIYEWDRGRMIMAILYHAVVRLADIGLDMLA